MTSETTKSPNGWAVYYAGDCCEAWRQTKDAVAYDALSVVFDNRMAANHFAAAAAEGEAPRKVYYCDGPQGFVVHER